MEINKAIELHIIGGERELQSPFIRGGKLIFITVQTIKLSLMSDVIKLWRE